MLLLVHQAVRDRLEGRHRGHRVGLRRHGECRVGAAGPTHQSRRPADAVDVGEDVIDLPTDAEVGVVAAEATAPHVRQMAGEPVGEVSQQRLPVEVAVADDPL